jgi:hypothetical protein
VPSEDQCRAGMFILIYTFSFNIHI